ncbi:polynucleotide adenylyltransferase PcnB [Solimonas marina]|uniref:Poly(A) polymerase I n=1 Tax=Solimonas marina TaxID=2714601 RepID=A0A969WBT1_9GAMM|nr:polynucleotide adenylyltransferase PcnB [Solimonas marina]NKF23284.1 polynucleotide adenylyltransferase PcnB [Solimonas marina]
MNWLKTLFPRNRKIPVIKRVPRAEHPISRSQFPSGTLKVLYGLKDAGFEAYVVGGGVRDLLAGMEPKDFDIATNARPEEVRRIFRSCRLVGRRFLIAHVRFGDEISEVTTFRGPITDSHERDETGRILSDNEYGTVETDAFRRDFTVNAMYYDIRDFSIVDFAGGLEDIKAGVIRLIGDPELRYREDPVRMLRAVRIANKLRFRIEKGTAAPLRKLAPLLREIPPARLFDEVVKLLQCRDAVANLHGLREYGLLAQLLPHTDAAFDNPQMHAFVERALGNTAERIAAEQTVSPAFLYAALLWPAVARRIVKLCDGDDAQINVAIAQASDEVLAQALKYIMIPKRFSVPMREIWALQPRFEMRRGGRAQRLLTHPRFRAAYDFLLLRAHSGEVAQELADWWTEAQQGEGLPPLKPTRPDEAEPGAPRKRRRRRGGRGRRRPGGDQPSPPGA